MKNNRPYKTDVKNRFSTSSNGKPNKNKKGYKKNSSFENTIKIDEIRLNDSESLDTSFLEGRIEKKVSNSKKAKEKILQDNSRLLLKIRFFRKFFLSLAGICIIILVLLFSVDYVKNLYYNNKTNQDVSKKEKKDDTTTSLIDHNYLFVGDIHTKKFDFASFDMDYHYVSSGKDGLTSRNLLDEMKEYIYDYNPSIIFLEVGLYDMNDDVSLDDYASNLEEIILLIQKNRPYAKIYIESIYPLPGDSSYFDDSVKNDKIIEWNEKIKNICEKKNVSYLDVYSMIEKDGSLDMDYVEEDIFLNKEGYQQVYKLIQKVVG